MADEPPNELTTALAEGRALDCLRRGRFDGREDRANHSTTRRVSLTTLSVRSSAPASVAIPLKSAATRRPPALPKSISHGLHSVSTGGLPSDQSNFVFPGLF